MMKQRVRVLMFAGILSLLCCSLGLSQSEPLPPVVLKIQVTVSRYMGTNKLSSQPYVLSLAPNENGTIKFGTEVPVPAAYTSPSNNAGNNPQQPSYTMQQVGTQIDANAILHPDRRTYKLRLTVTERTVVPNAQATELGARVSTVPSFRNLVFGSTVYLTDGQSSQFSSATDKATGEVFKVDVSLAVDK
jgi:hypothetical protein